jgi:hypothetical protein
MTILIPVGLEWILIYYDTTPMGVCSWKKNSKALPDSAEFMLLSRLPAANGQQISIGGSVVKGLIDIGVCPSMTREGY